MTAEEYLAWEREQPTKHEFFAGEVFAMAGGSPRHNALCNICGTALTNALRARGCVVLTSDQRVTMTNGGRYVYPDVSVVCGRLEIEANDVLTNPTILVEVLAASTEQYDRGLKWESYQRIASLADYVLVSQTEPRIEHYRRGADAAGPTARPVPVSASRCRRESRSTCPGIELVGRLPCFPTP